MSGQPVASRERVAEALIDVAFRGNAERLTNGSRVRIADALLAAGVFRELPTAEALMAAIHNEGAYCGECDYDDGWKACEDCIKVLGWYAKAVLKLLGGDAK